MKFLVVIRETIYYKHDKCFSAILKYALNGATFGF